MCMEAGRFINKLNVGDRGWGRGGERVQGKKISSGFWNRGTGFIISPEIFDV